MAVLEQLQAELADRYRIERELGRGGMATVFHFNGPYYQHQLARIYVLVGEPEKALDQLEVLLKIPYELSPGWLRIDPNFASLRGNPRFDRLANGN